MTAVPSTAEEAALRSRRTTTAATPALGIEAVFTQSHLHAAAW